MTTRRRIICFILSALCLSSCAVFAPEPPQRVVRVKALADVSFRARNSRWPDEARGLIEAASDYYEREPDIITLIHELAHIFGAEHVEDRASIMHEDLGYRTEFDDKNRSIIAKNKLCPFARD